MKMDIDNKHSFCIHDILKVIFNIYQLHLYNHYKVIQSKICCLKSWSYNSQSQSVLYLYNIIMYN
jgi:hypothetical protein